MAVTTDRLEIVNILVAGEVPRASAEALATAISEHFARAASEDELAQQLNIERERSDARFEALTQRMDARFDQFQTQTDARFEQFQAQTDARFEQFQTQIDARFDQFQAQIDARFDRFQAQMDARFDQFQAQMDVRFAQVDVRFAEFETKVYRAVAAGTALILAAISVWAAFG